MSRTNYPRSMLRLVNELSRLPSVGEKTAVRLAYHLVTKGRDRVEMLAEALCQAAENIKLCSECYALSESEVCEVCSDNSRDRAIICVVEKPSDVIAIERGGYFSGLYHVLHGLWSPMRGVRPEDTKIIQLVSRITRLASSGVSVREVILATATTVEGDATALYLAEMLADKGVAISRIAQGLPQGGELEYSDDVTLSYALEGRRTIG
ncbi:MAG: recombination mediator RecR [bacterium]|nr:recombination mediator RecR [bacterium]